MDEREAESDGDRSEALGRALIGGAEDDEEEEEGKQELRDEAGEQGIAAGRMHAVAVRSKTGGARKALLAAGDDVKAAGSGDAAENLGNDIREKIAPGEASAGVEAEGDSGIEMRAGDVADGKGHGEHGEAEGESDARESDTELRIGRGEECRSAAAEDQPEGTKEFRKCPGGDGHEFARLLGQKCTAEGLSRKKALVGRELY